MLARRLKATIVHGDASDLELLEEAGGHTADVVLAVTPNDQDNLVICQLASLRFGVPWILALVNDPESELVFRELGIAAVSTTRILSKLIEERAGFEEIINLIPIDEGRVNLTEIVLRENSPVIGRSLREIELPDNSLVAYIIRQEHSVVPRGPTVLQAQDRLIVISLPENHGQVLKVLSGSSE
jgi:trk system potassium uptake protein TrkA